MLNLIWLNLALCIKFNLSSQGERGLNYAALAVASEASKIAPFFFFFGRGRGFYLRSVAPSSPKPSLTPLHVRGCCAMRSFIWCWSAENLNLTFSGCGFGLIKFEAEIYKFIFKFEHKTIRRSIFVLDEALLNLATGVTSSVMTEPNLKVTKYRAKRQAV